jgi:hypothetical protein
MRTKLLGLLFLISCSGQRDEKINKDVAELRNLSTFETLVEFNSDRNYKFKSIELDSNRLIKELKTKYYFTLLGKLFETKDNITIIGYIADDYGSPILITFDNNGKQISAHVIYENPMGDMGQYTTNIIKILPDRQILFTDSTTTRKINKKGTDEIPGTDSLSVKHKKYRLTDKGTIETVD